MKKLIPALAMLLVAAALMGTSTYAWFSANQSVTASGMQVKAASTGGLAIASYTANDNNDAIAPGVNAFKSAASAVWTNKTGDVQPTSADAGTWHTAVAKDVDNFAATSYTKSTATTGLYQQTKWQIKSLAETGTVSVAVTGIKVETADDVSSANLNNAIRVALCVTNGNSVSWFYFAPMYTEGSYTYINKDSSAVSYNTTGNNALNLGTAPGTVICTGLGTTPATIDAYVYYEGQDENCTSANAINIDTLKVTITYGVPANN